MSNNVYPVLPGLGYPVKRTPAFGNIVQETPYGFRTAIKQQQYAKIRFTLTYNYLRAYVAAPSPYNAYSEMDALFGFYQSMYGSFDNFLFTDPEYNLVPDSPSGSRVTLPLVSDGAISPTYYSPIRAQVGPYLALITDLNPLNMSGLKVYDNGVLKTAGTDFTVQTGASAPTFSFAGLVIKWAGTPTGPVTASFSYYFRCAFKTDEQEFEMFIHLMSKGVHKGQLVIEQVFDNA